ncbi:MAG: hypothetical protein C5B46_00915 [Proteobacteria bacterium]|nr:MAG: hypothetical protein C5B46_00915 [Pseudomonadota bacterium]
MQNVALSARTAGHRWLRATPAVAALLYPALLSATFRSARWLSSASGWDRLAGIAALAISLLLGFAVPALAFTVAAKLGRLEPRTGEDVRARGIAHLAFASPAMFTFLGVVVYLDGYPNGDYIVWAAFWIAITVWLWRGTAGAASSSHAMLLPTWLRPIHGVGAALLITGFILLHLFNHLSGFWSAETHIAVMHALRRWYRSGFVEPLVVVLMLFMVITGAILLRAKLTRAAGWFETLQTMTGMYLAIYIVGHMNSVFMYARLHEGIDTDFWFASSGKAGLFGDPWSVRLLPHYAVGVWAVITHAGCGLRTILLAHGVGQRRADRVAGWISVAGAAVAVPMILALVRIHLA